MNGNSRERPIHPTVFQNHLHDSACRYFPHLENGPAQVECVEARMRPGSALHRFVVVTEQERYRILVKAASDWRALRSAPPTDRPRLVHPIDPRQRCRSEYHTLTAIHTHFGGLADPRFGSVRVYEYLPEYDAIIMEEKRQPSLRRVLADSRRILRVRRAVASENVFRNAGSWLSSFHALEPPHSAPPLNTTRAEFVEWIASACDFVAGSTGSAAFCRHVSRTAVATAQITLPEVLPLGLRHGDYAPRNILVGPYDRVTVLDTPGQWRTPIYDDIGYFLAALRWWGMQPFMLTQRARILAYEQAFLQGYFAGGEVPWSAVRLYTLQALLDRMSATVARLKQADPFPFPSLRWWRLISATRLLRKGVADVLHTFD